MACDSPRWIQCKGQDIPVPCNRCQPCLHRRVNEWVFRVMYEERHSIASHFVTLTYNTAHVPLTPHGFMTLRKADFQKFMKRLRKNTGLSNIKYYACGEYGGQTSRPHYHAIIFNVPDQQAYADAWSIGGVQFGGLMVGTVTDDSVAYTMKYIEKDSFLQNRRRYRHIRDDRELEFSLSSKGLGLGYIDEPGIRRYHTSNLENNYVTKPGGYKVALPRYYRKKLYDEFQLEQQRSIISDRVRQKHEKQAYLFVPSEEFPTLADRLDKERQGRERKLLISRTKRDVL